MSAPPASPLGPSQPWDIRHISLQSKLTFDAGRPRLVGFASSCRQLCLGLLFKPINTTQPAGPCLCEVPSDRWALRVFVSHGDDDMAAGQVRWPAKCLKRQAMQIRQRPLNGANVTKATTTTTAAKCQQGRDFN